MVHVKSRFFLFSFILLLTLLALPAMADNVTISGDVTFASLDGSALDHDHTVNGVFTVDDGNLTILGTVNCNDTGSGSNSACSMAFVTSGNFVMAPGSSLYAENRVGGGNGGNVSVTAGGSITLQGPSGSAAGAIISTARFIPGGPNYHAGNITLTAGTTTSLQAGTIVNAAAGDGTAGTINVSSAGVITVAGLVSAGPTSLVNSATKYTGEVLSGGVSGMVGGTIRIASSSHDQPAVTVTGDAIVVTQGANNGTGSVTIEGCDVRINGLVASLSRDGSGARVAIRSGTSITVDGRDVNGSGPASGRFGVIRADSTANGTTGAMLADLFAQNDITIYGPSSATSSVFGVNANGSNTPNDTSGTIRVISTGGAVTASGNAFSASGTQHGDIGGVINVSSKNNATLNTAVVKANGDFTSSDTSRTGGKINVRSYSGSVTWQNGSGDVRPTGTTSGVGASQQGSITLTYCTSVNTSGSTFPTNGPAAGTFPTLVNSCSPAAPSLPAGEPALPTCNRPPVAVNDAYTVAEGGTLNVAAPGVLANDSDPDGDPITAVLVSGPAHASSFTLNANGSFTYVHDGSETTSDSFTYRASDGASTSNLATVSITVTPVNDPPVANNDTATVAEGGTINMAAPGVLANDTDPDGPTMTAILVSGPAHASSFALNANGSYIYVHDGSETTSDSFTYKVSDGSLFSNVATVSITITPVNDPPVANNDSYSVNEGGTLNVAAPGVMANDTDPDSPTLTATIVSGPAHAASFTFNADGSFSYTHDGSETTSDSFTYKVSDGSLFSNVATVSITVNPVNDAPVALPDAYSVNEGGTLSIAAPGVLANDTDVDSPTLTAILVSGPAHASSFALNANGSFNYVHDGSETTIDSFTYKANDGSLDSNIVTVTIVVVPVNDAPTAANDAYSVNEGGTLSVAAPGVLANDTDPDSPVLTAVLVSGPAHASSFTLNADGSFNYVHDGSETTTDTFTYTANDGFLNSNTATVTITINPVNDPPVAVADTYTVNEGGTLNVTAPGVLANDTDPDSPVLTAVLVSGPAHASGFALNADGSFNYTHDGSETTVDTFTYKANDGSLDSNTVTVTININPVNDPPVANDDSYTVAEGGTLNITAPGVLGNDTDADTPAASLTASLVSGPAHAAAFNLNPDGSFNYIHDGSETTVDTFTYKVSDGSAFSNIATVTIHITPVNDPPVANNDAYNASSGVTLNVAAPGVLGNDTDPDGPTMTAVLVSGPAHAASFALNANGSFSYQSTAGFSGTDTFTYKVSDGSLFSNTATVTITVTNQPPVAVNDSFNAVGNTQLRVGTGPTSTPSAQVAGSVLDNDTDSDTPHGSLFVSAFDGTSAAGGSVSMNPNGTFSYVPPAGFTGNDTFHYSVSDGTSSSTGLVTIVVSNRVWYVNNTAGSGDGRSISPFSTLSAASGAAGIGDIIYVHAGNGTTSGQNSGITLMASQQLLGEGVALVVGPYTLNPAGTTPSIGNAGGIGVTMNSGNTVAGLNVSASLTGINATAQNNGTISKVAVTGGTDGISLSTITGTWNLIDVTASTAFSSGRALAGTGSGTLSFSGTTSVTATNGTALDLSGLALSGTLASANASNDSSGIRLNSTTGSLTINGGTISNMTGRGAQIIASTNVTLKNMTFNNTASVNGDTAATCGDTLNGTNTNCSAAIHLAGSSNITLDTVVVNGSKQIGINGNNVTGLTMSNVEVKNAGDEAFEHGVQFVNLAGTVTITNCNFHNNFYRQFTIQNGGGSMNASITGTTFNGNGIGVSTGAQGALISAHGSASMTVNVQSSIFSNNFASGYFSDLANGAVMNVTVDNSTFTSNGSQVVFGVAGTGNLTYDVSGNTMTGAGSAGIAVSTSAGGVASGTVKNNIIGSAGVAASGCSVAGCNAIELNGAGTGTFAATVSTNTINQFAGQGIRASDTSGSASLQVKVNGNTVSNPVAGATNGIFAQSGALSTDTTSVCADIFGNTISGAYSSTQIRVRNRFATTTFRLPGYAGAGNDTTAVAAFLSGQNGGATASATINANVYSGGAACTTP